MELYGNPNQFKPQFFLRELNKAYIGFCGDSTERMGDYRIPVCTGKWGCGAFGGDT